MSKISQISIKQLCSLLLLSEFFENLIYSKFWKKSRFIAALLVCLHILHPEVIVVKLYINLTLVSRFEYKICSP